MEFAEFPLFTILGALFGIIYLVLHHLNILFSSSPDDIDRRCDDIDTDLSQLKE